MPGMHEPYFVPQSFGSEQLTATAQPTQRRRVHGRAGPLRHLPIARRDALRPPLDRRGWRAPLQRDLLRRAAARPGRDAGAPAARQKLRRLGA